MKSNLFYKTIGAFLLATLIFINCTEPYTPDTTEEDQQYVVEGYVESGENALPVYVIVTKSIPFITEVNQSTFESIFIDSAEVIVNDGDKDIELIKLCTNDPNLPAEIKEAAAEFLGIDPGEMGPNICIYVDLFNLVTKEVGRKYDLTIHIGNDTLTSTTTIARNVPLFEFRWDDPPGEPSDSLARLWAKINDPAGTDYFRYLTGINDRGLIPPFQSVTDDTFFDGQEFEFPLNKADYPEDETDPNSFGLYPRGDSVFVKWMTMDKVHFDFWNTRDYAANSGGPFANYTRIAGNINGALGIWGGYSVNQYSLFCPPK